MKKTIEYHTEYRHGNKFMECRCCGVMVPVTNTTTSVKCDLCVREDFNNDFPFTPAKRYAPSGKPRGWKFMKEYIDKDGNVFNRGVEMPLLKNTLPPTVIKPKPVQPKLSKGQKAQLYTDTLSTIHKLKKELAKAKLKKDQKRITLQIKKLQKTIK